VSRRVRFCYVCRPGVVMADVQRFMVAYEATFGVLSPDEARVFTPDVSPPGISPAALWHRGVLTLETLSWFGRN
jgi:hypothetical protein